MVTNKIKRLPSFELPWLKNYRQGAYEEAMQTFDNQNVFNFFEKLLKQQGDKYPAIEYFGRKISRSDFINNSYTWANVLKNLGVKAGDIVPIYSLWIPEICYLLMAMNMIGATPYFLKLQISDEALEDETHESDFVIVLDQMWEKVSNIFSRDRFKKVMFLSANDSLPFVKKIYKNIKDGHNHNLIVSDKYFYASEAKHKYSKYDGIIKNPKAYTYNAFITSSSGTTSADMVKGVISSNKAILSQIIQAKAAEVNFLEGKRALANLPPTAATSLICLFLYPLFFNQTVVVEPRLSEEGFYDSLMELRPQIALMTGAFWMAVFRRAEEEIRKGNKVDMSFFDMPIMGGEGSTVEDLKWMNGILHECGSKVDMFSGYGMSEMCSVFSVDKLGCSEVYEEEINTVGIPYPGVTLGIFDDEGNELSYDGRGELWVKSNSLMVGYYAKDELTSKTVVNGWLKTGDIFKISESGHLYFYGRKSDCVNFGKKKVYLFDISNEIQKIDSIRYALTNAFKNSNGNEIVCHLVLRNEKDDKLKVLKEVEKAMNSFLPDGMQIAGYKFHENHLSASPTTAKIDRNAYMKELDGYFKPVGDNLIPVSFRKTKNGTEKI